MMKKLSILIFFALILLFSGCSQKLEDGILKVDKEYKEKNSKTKVYYVDNSYEKTRNQLDKLINDLNNNKIVEIEFGRDYNNTEIRELKKIGKPLDVNTGGII